MEFTKRLLIGFILVSSSAFGKMDLPRFAAKFAVENIRFMTQDGRFSYTQKRSGALTLSTSFRSTDVIEGAPGTNYHVTATSARKKILVEVERDWHRNMDLTKLHDIQVGTFNGTQFNSIGQGRAARLHLDDEWASWFDPKEKAIHVQRLKVADDHHVIRLGKKHNPFFTPEVVMVDANTILYTDINDKGFAAVLAWNIRDRKMTVVQKATASGTRMELCRQSNYVALGDFSYEDANRGSSISVMAWTDRPNLAGFTSVYRVSDNDIGNMLCAPGKIWFVKTMSEDRKLNTRVTEAVSLDLATKKVTAASELERVTQLIDMDGRILLPYRDEIYVLEGSAGSNTEVLKTPTRGKP